MTSSRIIYFFLLLSVLAHAGLGQWLDGDNSRRLAGSTIAVSLLLPNSQYNSSLASRQSAGGISISQMSGPALQKSTNPDVFAIPGRLGPSRQQNRIQQSGIVALDSSDNADTSTSQPGRTQAFATGKLLKRMLLNNMTQYFNYPRFALIRGWQGEVIIGIRIEPDGYISRTRLVNSSGYGTLDLAALEGARKVKSLPNAVALLNGQPFDLQLPVIYRLQDG